MGLIRPLYGDCGIQEMPTGGCVVAISIMPGCGCFDSKAQWRWDIYSRLSRWYLSSSCGNIPKHGVGAHAVDPSYCRHGARGLGCWSWLYLQGEGNSLISLNHTLWGYSKSLYVGQVSWGSPRFSADLKGACGCQGKEGSQCCGHVWWPVVQRGAWDLRWSISSMFLSFGRPSLLHF